jgi:hypothetical protein
MQPTVPLKFSNRKATADRDLKLLQLEALIAFANLGETPDSWRRFRLKWPEFFPTANIGVSIPGFNNLSEWFYHCVEEWAKWESDLRAQVKTHLFWYRDHVRAVLTCNDSDGARLSILLGFEEQAKASGYLDSAALVTIGRIPGKSTAESLSMPNLDVLPRGRAVVNGITGAIEWEFGCALQQAVYELMRHRWRAKVCPECGQYFIADKTAQAYCSTVCYQEKKRKQSLDYWRREGSDRRDERKHKTKSRGRK